MRIKVESDLHVDVAEYYEKAYNTADLVRKPDLDGIDVYILPGDVGQGEAGYLYSKELLERYPKLRIIHVAGNHEYYDNNIESLDERLADKLEDRYFYLQNDSVVIDGIRFIGSTMWTDFNRRDRVDMWWASTNMNDYRMIRTGPQYNRFTPEYAYSLHQKAKRFIFDTLQESKEPCIVVTHHKPYVSDRGLTTKTSDLQYAYEVDLEEEFARLDRQPLYWFFGHTHQSEEKDFFIANCHGYPGEDTNFNPERIFEV